MKHRVSVGRDNREHGLEKSFFEPGEKGVFFIRPPSDSSSSVTSEEADVRPDWKEGPEIPDGRVYYSFPMPDKDVRVQISFRCDMFRMGPEMRKPERPRFCPECGARTEPTWTFCSACGYRLTPPEAEKTE